MNNSDSGLVSQILFPKGNISRRARDARFLLLSLFLALMFCGALAAILLLLNKQGRV